MVAMVPYRPAFVESNQTNYQLVVSRLIHTVVL